MSFRCRVSRAAYKEPVCTLQHRQRPNLKLYPKVKLVWQVTSIDLSIKVNIHQDLTLGGCLISDPLFILGSLSLSISAISLIFLPRRFLFIFSFLSAASNHLSSSINLLWMLLLLENKFCMFSSACSSFGVTDLGPSFPHVSAHYQAPSSMDLKCEKWNF